MRDNLATVNLKFCSLPKLLFFCIFSFYEYYQFKSLTAIGKFKIQWEKNVTRLAEGNLCHSFKYPECNFALIDIFFFIP